MKVAKVRPSLARSNLRLYTFACTKTTAKPTNQSVVKNACGVQKWVDAYILLTVLLKYDIINL